MTDPAQRQRRMPSIQALHQAWGGLQVELQGQYSSERLARLHAYQRRRSWRGVLAILLSAALPCLVVITLIDCVPLRPTGDGVYANYVFWIRATLATGVVVFSITDQLRTFLPQFPFSTRSHVLVVVGGTLVGSGQMLGMAVAIGFPVPFCAVLATPAVAVVVMGCLVWTWRNVLRANPSWWLDLGRYFIVLCTQISLTIIYPAYVYFFTALNGHQQTASVLVLPIIKIMTKNIISRCLHGQDDLKPQGIILNIEVFNSLYVSMCMQNSTSRVTTIVLMSVDFIQAWVSVMDMNEWIVKVQKLVSRLPPASTGRPHNLVDIAVVIIESVKVHPTTLPFPPGGGSDFPEQSVTFNPSRATCGKKTKVACASCDHHVHVHRHEPAQPIAEQDQQRKRLQELVFTSLDSPERTELVKLIRQILFVTEFLMLVEYIEVVIPIAYSVYISTMFYLPNRAFYPQTKDIDANRLKAMIGGCFMYTSFEFLSFMTLGLLLRYRLRLSGFCQLAFVLDTQSRFVQANLMVWMVYIVQTTLVHFGVDFSMEFTWLKNHQSP